MRLRTTAALAATSVLTAGAAAVAAGRYAADAALRPARPSAAPPSGTRSSTAHAPLPAGFRGPALTVHASGEGRVELTRSLTARLPGCYGLTGRGCHAVVGPVLDEETERSGADTVVRRLERVTRGELKPGTKVWLTPQVYEGSPQEALGIEYYDITIRGELGPLPAWFVPGYRDTWVIAIHGLGASTEQPLNLLPFWNRVRLPVLGLAYRGDPGAPRPDEDVRHLGDTEWRDVEAAVGYAVRHGAERVILHGWSSGATMALRAAVELSIPGGETPGEGPRGRISGLVLDSPVLDWRATLRGLAAARHMPRPLLPLAVRAAQGRTGLRVDRPTTVVDPGALNVPTLLLHGPDDTIAPWDASQAFAEARGEMVTLHPVLHAPHAAMWNAAPEDYEETVRRFGMPLV